MNWSVDLKERNKRQKNYFTLLHLQEQSITFERMKRREERRNHLGEFNFRASCDILSSNICISNLL